MTVARGEVGLGLILAKKRSGAGDDQLQHLVRVERRGDEQKKK